METVTSMFDTPDDLPRGDLLRLAVQNQIVSATAARLVVQIHHMGEERQYADHLERFAQRSADNSERARDCLFRTIGNGATEATWFESTRGNWS